MAGSKANANLVLATLAFAISFAVWGLVAALAPMFKASYRLTATETSLMVAIPVLLGAVGRVPIGMLTDRLGGRLIFSLLLAFSVVPCLGLALDHSYPALLFWGLWIGLAGTSFVVGVGLVSPWFPAARQGTALGIYGAGNIGQSAAAFAAPHLAEAAGVGTTFTVFGLVSLAWAAVFAGLARDAPRRAPPPSVRESLGLIRGEPTVWMLSALYFLTFGGFVALGISLPVLLRELFDLRLADAGARTAGFVVLATLARPLGGWAADQVGGRRLLRLVFFGLAASAWVLIVAVTLLGDGSSEHQEGGLEDGRWASPAMYLFTLGALASAALLGLGNGAIFKLVPLYFPRQTGTATGLVGAAGGLGGFFPAITLGLLRDLTDSYAAGFALLSAYALGCIVLLYRLPSPDVPPPDVPSPPAPAVEPDRSPLVDPPAGGAVLSQDALFHSDRRPPRGLSPTRLLSIALRTVHLAAFGLLLGGYAFDAPAERMLPWLALTVVSGGGLVLLELRAVGLAWFTLAEGALVVVKLLLLLATPLVWDARVPLLLLVLAIGSVSSHLPARYRHYSLLRRRVLTLAR